MSTDLATRNGQAPQLAAPDPTMTRETLDLMLAEAQQYVDSGLLPTSIKTPAAALLIMKAGRELGIPATYALRNIHVISNRPTCSAELMMTLVHQRYGPSRILVKESTSQRCVVLCRPLGWDVTVETVWTLEDAKQAKLLNKPGPWQEYPRAMLRSRAVSEACRTHFPAAIAGMYTPEELGAPVSVDGNGGLIVEGQVREVVNRETGEILEPDPAPQEQPEAAQSQVDAFTALLKAIGHGDTEGYEEVIRQIKASKLASLLSDEEYDQLKPVTAAEKRRIYGQDQ